MIGLFLSIIRLHLSGAISTSVPGRLVLSPVHMGAMCQLSNKDISPYVEAGWDVLVFQHLNQFLGPLLQMLEAVSL